MKTLNYLYGAFMLTVLSVGHLFAQNAPDSDGNIFIDISKDYTAHAGAGTYADNTPWDIKAEATSPFGNVLATTNENLSSSADNPSSANYGSSVSYDFTAEAGKSHYVWVLLKTPTTSTGRFFASINGKCIDKRTDTEFAELRSRIDFDNWQWVRVGNNVKDLLVDGTNEFRIYHYRKELEIARILLAPSESVFPVLDQATNVAVSSNDASTITITWSEPSKTGFVMEQDNNTERTFLPSYLVSLNGSLITEEPTEDAPTKHTDHFITINKSELQAGNNTLSIQLAQFTRRSSSSDILGKSSIVEFTFDESTPPDGDNGGGETPGDEQQDEAHTADKNGVYMFQATQYLESKAGTGAFDGETWMVGNDAVHGNYMYLENTSSDNRNETSAERAISPSLVYKINMPEAQTGFVWALINEGSKDGGRLWANMNDLDLDKRKPGEYGSAARSRISADMAGEWQWILINNQANSDVVKADDNIIEFFKARPNIKIAKIAFTPQQDINLIIDTPEARVTANDGTNVTIGWDEPTLTGDLYDNSDNIYATKSYVYRVKLGDAVIGDNITARNINIPVTDLETPQLVTVEVGHEFKKNSSSTHMTYSLEAEITVDKNSQPGGDEDTEAPTKPTNLASSEVTSSSVKLTWTASTDNVAVVGYKVTQNGTDLSTTSSTNEMNVTGLAASTEYTFTVRAYDAAGNESEASDTETITTSEAGETPGTGIIIQADEDKIYTWDATDFELNKAGSGAFEGEQWLVGSDPEVGRFMYLSNTDTTTNANKETANRADSPSLIYNLAGVDASSSRYIWALVNQGQKNSGTLYADLNGICAAARKEGEYGIDFGSRVSEEAEGKWQWIQVGYNVQSIAKDGQLNTVEIFKGYPDIKIAKLMFTRTQEYVPIINNARVFIQENDGANVTVSWDAPKLQYLLYDHELNLFGEGYNTPDYTYKVRVEGQSEVEIKDNFIKIPYSQLNGGKTVTVQIGHLFRTGSTKSQLSYSLPTRLAGVTEDSQPDFDAPSQPTDLTAVDVQGTNVALSWTASTDNVGVLGYNIYQDGIKIQTTTATSFKVNGLSTSTEYTFEVDAYDAAGNVSAKSDALTLTTRDKDDELTDRPSEVEDLATTLVTHESFTLSWRPSNSLNGITAYYVFLREQGSNEEFRMIAHLNGETFSFGIEGLDMGVTYEMMVRAEDGEGHLSEESEIHTQKTNDEPLSANDNLKVSLIEKVYPNPSVSDINIEFTSEVSYLIYNLTGQTLVSGTAQKVKVDLPKGTYILVAIDRNGNRESAKLLCF
ncbi:fibronectin type III domain-containing protein [Flammeovirga pacifica]|uniref:Fibronectin type-III domain-containing protein n=1 Tax=Flammeovirga pacifica TaxID=915059 RepID=A0A1S1Z079_FLAPC|nr:fibronectin type III domain-containing protein [Flammeovirga pacifica]OHX66674.1 hypothetical protein NH26_10035 [Flammeovirga pacifica]